MMEIYPALFIVSSISILSYLLINDLQIMNKKLLIYSYCANKMMDYGFKGQIYNFTECYNKYINKYINKFYNYSIDYNYICICKNISNIESCKCSNLNNNK